MLYQSRKIGFFQANIVLMQGGRGESMVLGVKEVREEEIF